MPRRAPRTAVDQATGQAVGLAVGQASDLASEPIIDVESALQSAVAWLRRDPVEGEDRRAVLRAQREIRRLVDVLCEEHPTEACELCLLLEDALSIAAVRVQDGSPAGASGSRLAILRVLLRIASKSGHSFYEAEGHLRTAELELYTNLRKQAERSFAAAIRVAGAARLPLLLCSALGGQARLAQREGNFFKAHSLFNQQLASARGLGEPALIQSALCSMAVTALAMGDRRRSARFSREHLFLARCEGDESAAAEAQLNLGLALQELARVKDSQRHLEEALTSARRLGLWRIEAHASYHLAAGLQQEDPALALALTENARRLLPIIEGAVDPLRADCEALLASATRALGRERASATLARATQLVNRRFGPPLPTP